MGETELPGEGASAQRQRYMQLAVEAVEMARRAEGKQRSGYLKVARRWLELAGGMSEPTADPPNAF